ncbi:IPT/TIG domain-containing protein [Pontibacter sp. SGAir0037]|uniref:IPT/TIG domain-containing protein n=1 Tax=Pontibacter sp. SGAir0037 TaxID=2571030 RepID=UPI00143D706C|nr:IPT/TIG domain-containing protein [Pontibacter sp. SGAir0037]
MGWIISVLYQLHFNSKRIKKLHMKSFYNIRLLLLVCLVICFGIITSCDDDDDALTNSGEVELLSFGPTGAQHGEELRFIGRNLNKVEAIVLPGVTVAKADFKAQSSELITLIIPAEATEGKVTLKLAGGQELVTKTVLSFEVPVTIATITEKARPGANITITGTKLNWITGVIFSTEPIDTVDEFVSQTPSELVLTVPVNAKTGKLLILTGGTEPLELETEEEFVVALPTVTALAPGLVRHEENLTLTGTDLDLLGAIVFPGGTRVSDFVSQTANQVVVKVPNNANAGSLTLVAKNSLVATETEVELKLVLPAITSMTPNPVKHGANLTISGTNLDHVKSVVFNGEGAVASTFVSQSSSSIVVTVPNKATAGNLKFITKRGDYSVTTAAELRIVLPAITNATPSPVDPGANLTITGTNLDLVKSVVFNGDASVSNFVSKTASQIVVTIPNNARSGALKLVTTSNFEVTTQTEVEVVLPAVTSLTPSPVLPGAYLTLNGSGLNLIKEVRFVGGAKVTSFLAQTASQIILGVPANAKTGKLTLVTVRNLEIETSQTVEVGTGGPAPLAYALYEDALQNGWQEWTTGANKPDLANTEHVLVGSKAIKVNINQWGSWGGGFSTAAAPAGKYTEFTFWVYGAPGVNGKVRLLVNPGNWDDRTTFTVVEGKWTEVTIQLADLTDNNGVRNPATWSDIRFQSEISGEMWFDHIGFR